MKYYLAPLEGITTYIYRNAYHKYFSPADKYFTPFLVPHMKKGFSQKEKNEVLPEHNKGMYLVPQIMSNDAQGFLATVEKLKAYGYREVNLNLGCPSKTVVSKGRGAGFLAKPEELARFLDEVYEKSDVEISVKTRIGLDNPEEFPAILEIYNQYPVKELIIHPRVQKDFYRNRPDLQVFGEALLKSHNPVCYNGDLFSVDDCEEIQKRFPEIKTMMLGRGVISDPGLLEELQTEKKVEKERLRAFHDKILEDYRAINFGDTNVLFKMKELWFYMGNLFPGREKLLKKLKKAVVVREYEKIVDEIFR